MNAPHHRAAANRPDLKERRGRRLRVHVVVMRLLCWFGIHDWGRQDNIREGKADASILFLPFFLMTMFLGPPRVCDRKCLRCGKVKEFPYDPAR